MESVRYSTIIPYLHDGMDGTAYPGLWLTISNPLAPQRPPFEIDVHLDSGTATSIFRGDLCSTLDIELFDGETMRFASAMGTSLDAYVHPVVLRHDDLGQHEMRVAFSATPMRRNLLGRDFFEIMDIGFRERELRLLFAHHR